MRDHTMTLFENDDICVDAGDTYNLHLKYKGISINFSTDEFQTLLDCLTDTPLQNKMKMELLRIVTYNDVNHLVNNN